MDQEVLEGHLEDLQEFLLDEGERQVPPSLPTALRPTPPPLHQRRNVNLTVPALPDFFPEEQGAGSPTSPSGGYVAASYLAAMREQLPNLAGFPDAFILSTPMQTLLKMESNAMKRSSVDKSRNVEDKLSFNMDLISSTKLEIQAGEDDRNENLHVCRFLPAPICAAKELWLHARDTLGTTGLPPVGCFDMAAVGLAGYITSRGWIEIHNPGSASLSLRLFNIANMACRVAASKRISLNDADDTLEVGENLKDVASFFEFQQSLRAARVAQQFCMWWNFSITALESYLINNNFMSEKVQRNTRGVGTLSAFCDHVFLLNSLAWRARKPFLDVVDLGSVWASWAPGHLVPGEAFREPRAGPSGVGKKPSGQSASKSGGSSSGPARAPPPKPKSRQPRQPDDVCRRFNIGNCPAGAAATCTLNSGQILRHKCNFRLPNGGLCGAGHPRVGNH
jgi:hypothetical protein